MASVGSSSRFCYLALKDGSSTYISKHPCTKEQIEFEKECPFLNISKGHLQLDAYVSLVNADVYVEVKYHEIFSLHIPKFKK